MDNLDHMIVHPQDGTKSLLGPEWLEFRQDLQKVRRYAIVFHASTSVTTIRVNAIMLSAREPGNHEPGDHRTTFHEITLYEGDVLRPPMGPQRSRAIQPAIPLRSPGLGSDKLHHHEATLLRGGRSPDP